MKVKVPYRDGIIQFESDVNVHVVDSPAFEVSDQDMIIKEALANPIDSKSFHDFAEESESLLFILCDGTRPTPTALVLKHLYDDIKNHSNLSFIIATGSHRPPTENELSRIFGQYLEEFRSKIMVHDSRVPEYMVELGTTERGTPVAFNRAAIEAHGVVTINSVEPHYFAGFTGGRKSFLPGVAGFPTIERNHSYTMWPGSGPLALEGNPVSEDMFEAAEMLGEKRIFSIQTVMTGDHRLYSASTGNMNESFFKAVEKAKELYSVEIPGKTSIVVTVAPPPMDSNLYQSQKALEHARSAIEDGGIVILVASCWDGIGDPTFYNMLKDFKEGDDISKYIGDNYKLGNHKAARMLTLKDKVQIFGVTDIDQAMLEPARIVKKNTLQEAVDRAIEAVNSKGMAPSITVLPSGSLIVPRVRE